MAVDLSVLSFTFLQSTRGISKLKSVYWFPVDCYSGCQLIWKKLYIFMQRKYIVAVQKDKHWNFLVAVGSGDRNLLINCILLPLGFTLAFGPFNFCTSSHFTSPSSLFSLCQILLFLIIKYSVNPWMDS